MKLGCGTVLFRNFDLETALRSIRECGFTYFETQAVGPWCPHVDVERDDPESLVRLKDKYGFAGITGLWTKDGNLISNPRAVESNIRSIQWAAAAGIPVLHTGDGHKPPEMAEETARGIFEERLALILEAARRYGVTVAIEPHGAFSLTAEGLLWMMSLGEPSVLGINYDACNVFRGAYVESGNNASGWQRALGRQDELAVLKEIGARVVHFHAKDMNAQKQCVALGQGLVRLRECIDYMIELGYEGVLSVETEGGDDLQQVKRLAADSFAFLKEWEG